MAVYTGGRCGAALGAWLQAGTLCVKCERDDTAARLGRRADLAQTRQYAECGEAFLPAQLSQRFCSSPCRLRAWRRGPHSAETIGRGESPQGLRGDVGGSDPFARSKVRSESASIAQGTNWRAGDWRQTCWPANIGDPCNFRDSSQHSRTPRSV